MAGRDSRATVVLCTASRSWDGSSAERPRVPVTRVVDLDTLLRGGERESARDLALSIDPAWLASRQALRGALVQARHAMPGLEAAVLSDVALAHHSILAEEGIRVVVVDAFADVGRGSRRPAPAGWPCRNVAWGLWEVRACPPRRSSTWSWLPGLPRPTPSGLHIGVADGVGPGGRSFARLLDWTGRAVTRGRAVAVTLAELPVILEGGRPAPLATSVLRAA